MKIVLIGATGYVGAKILDEAVRRGHTITAIVRNIEKLPKNDLIIPVAADVNDSAGLTKHFQGQDAVIHAYAPPRDKEVSERVAMQRTATKSIISALKKAGLKRILAVGGAGGLEVAPGIRNMDFPDFPLEWIGGAISTVQVKGLLYSEDSLEWTYLCPSHNLVPGERTGKFRLGRDQLLIGADGESRISLEDYAMAMIDELEQPKHTGHLFTVGY